MTRKEFISKLPIGATIAFSVICNGSCRQKEKLESAVNENTLLRTDTLPNPNEPIIDLTINLDDPNYSKLKTPGKYVFYESTIIVYTEEKEYIAATKYCSDENLPALIWKDKEFFCREHAGTFNKKGMGTKTHNNLGWRGIATYNTELNGNLLRIYS